MTVDSFKKNLAIFLGALYLGVNSIFAYSTESNFWAERRKEVRRSGGVPLTLAALPANERRGPLLPSLSPVNPTAGSFLSEEVMKGVSPSFLLKNKALFTSLSQKYGTIRKISMGAGSSGAQPVVVHIQDVHQNEEAQQNIGAVIKSALLSARVDIVALEGLSGPLDLAPFRTYQNQQAVQQAADYLLSKNEISGPIHGLLTGEGRLPLVIGIDDPTHYNANVEAYRGSAPRVEAYRELIQERAKQLEKQKETAYSIPLREFDRQIEKYRNQEISLGEYVRVLVARGKDYGIPPSLQLFSKTLELEQVLDFRQVEIERAQVIERLIERITSQQEEALMSHTLAYRAGQMRYAEFYVALKDLCETSGVSLAAFPALDHYIRYVLLADQIDGESLLREMKESEKKLFVALAQSTEERRLVDQSWKIHLTQKLVEFSLAPEEWASYVSAIHSGESLALEETDAGKAVGTGWDLRTFEAFYQEAHARDVQMATHLLRVLNKDDPVALLVTGGFHAPGIEKQLTDAGVTVVSFVPRIKTLDRGHGTTYLSVFTQEKTPLEQLFQGEKLFLAKNPARPSIMKMLLPALVVGVALWGVGDGVDMDPNVLYASLGGVGVLAGLKFLKDRVQFNISRRQGSVFVSVDVDSEGIRSVSEGVAVSWVNSLSEGLRNGKKKIKDILIQISNGLEKNIYYPLRAQSFLLPKTVNRRPVLERKGSSSLRLVPVVDSLLARADLFHPSIDQTKFGEKVLAVFERAEKLSGRLRKKIMGRDKKGPSSSVVAMHPVGGVGMNAFQRGLLEKKARENAPLGLRRGWAEKIAQSLTNPHFKSSIDAFELVAPVRQLISLLRMEEPEVTIGGLVLPVCIHLISGSPEDLPHGMPHAFGTIFLGKGRKSSRVTIGVFPNDLAAVLHEGLEIIFHTDRFAGQFKEREHTYSFLGEILANKPSNGNVVPKRAIEELGKKTKSELEVFLNKGLQTLLEISSRFSDPREKEVHARLVEIYAHLTGLAFSYLREQGQNPVGLINRKVPEIERAFAIGSFIEVESEIEELERALYHLQKERGPHPLLRHYVDGIKDRHQRIQARFGDTQIAIAQRFSIDLGSLEEHMRHREWVSLWQKINKMRMGRSLLRQDLVVQEQGLLFELWDKIGNTLTPLMRGGDWLEADQQVEALEAYGLDVIRNHGIENQYLETVLFDFLAIYRAQRDLAHRQPQEAERFTSNLKKLNDSSFESGPLSKEDQAQVIRLLGGTKFKFAEWEVAFFSHILTRLALRFPPQVRFFLPSMGHPGSLKSHSPVFYRILSNYPALRVSPNDLSALFSSFISHQLEISDARGRLVEWGVSPSDADLYLLDLSELKPRPFPQFGRTVHSQRGIFLAEMAGLLFLAVLFPLAMGNGGLVFGIAALAAEPIVVVGILGLSFFLGVGFLGFVWRGIKQLLEKASLRKSNKMSTAQAILAILQEEPLPLGVDGGSLIETVSHYSTDRTFLRFLRENLRKSGNLFTIAQVRRQVLAGLGLGTPLNAQTGPLDVGGGHRPLTIFYLDGAGVPEDGNLMPVFERYLVGNGAEVVVVPVDAKAGMATVGLAGKIGIRVLDGLPPGPEGERTGLRYGLAKVERRLSSLGVDFDHYTACHVVAPLGLEIDVEGIKSNFFREALVILLDGLTAIMVRRSDLLRIDRVARAVASAA